MKAHLRGRIGRPHPGRRVRGVFKILLAGLLLGLIVISAGTANGGTSRVEANDLTLALPSPPQSLDPCQSGALSDSLVLRGNVFEELTNVDLKSGAVKPQLALSWKQNSPTLWTFQIRKGVKFQDGSNFNALTAAYILARTFGATKFVCLNTASLPKMSIQAHAVGPYTLKIATQPADPVLPLHLSTIEMTSPNSTPENVQISNPVGTGPYAISKYTPGQSLVLSRFAGYWGKKPDFGTVTYRFVSNDSVRADMVKTNEADMTINVPVQDVTSDGSTQRYPTLGTLSLRPDPTLPPLNDIRVRQAVALAINKKLIVQSLMPKDGAVSSQYTTSATANGFIPKFSGPAYNPQKAKSLIAAAANAGVPVNTTIPLYNRVDLFAEENDVIQAIVAELNDVGLHVQQFNQDVPTWKTQNNKPFAPHTTARLVVEYDHNVTGDASGSFSDHLLSTGVNSTVNDPVLDKLMTQAAVSGGAKRASLYRQAAMRFYTQYDQFPVLTTYAFVMHGKRVKYTAGPGTAEEIHISDIQLVKG